MTKSSKINSNISTLSSRRSKNVIIISLMIIIIVIVYLIITTFYVDNRRDPFDSLNVNNTYYSILNPPEKDRRVSSHWDLNNPICRTNTYDGVRGAIPKDYLSPDKPPFTGYPEKGYYDDQTPASLKCYPSYDCISSMLDTAEGWHAFVNDSIRNNSPYKEWLQLDLGSVMTVSGVVTQSRGLGLPRSGNYSNQMVSKYTVKYSIDIPPNPITPTWYPSTWIPVDNNNIFNGNILDNIKNNTNSNPNKKEKNVFNTPVSARYIRIYPQEYFNHISMRAGLLIPNSITIRINDKPKLYKITDGSININNITYQVFNPPDNSTSRKMSSSFSNSNLYNHSPSMLDSPQGWSAATNNNQEWLEIILGAPTAIAGVITQSRGIGFPGSGDYSTQMVTQYQVQYWNGISWVYVDNSKKFIGNSPIDDKILNLFTNLIMSTSIRILPTNAINHTSMRAGLLIRPGEPKIIDGIVTV